MHLAYCRYGTPTRYRAIALSPQPPPLRLAERCSHCRSLQAQASPSAMQLHRVLASNKPNSSRLLLPRGLVRVRGTGTERHAQSFHRTHAPASRIHVWNTKPEPNRACEHQAPAAPTTRESTPSTAIGVIGTWPQNRRRPSTSQRCFRRSSTSAPPSWRTTL